MLFITIVIAVFILIFVVNFVVTNVEMFRTSFDIVIGFPFIKQWTYTLEGIEFVYIVGGSVLLGALVIALGTWVLDAKRKLKLRSVRKELKHLQQAIEEARSSLPQEEAVTSTDEETVPSPTPEEITKSFEDSVQQRGFLEDTEEHPEESEEHPEESKEEPGYETVDEREVDTRESEYDASDPGKSLPRETPIEAELVESEDVPDEEQHDEEEPDPKG